MKSVRRFVLDALHGALRRMGVDCHCVTLNTSPFARAALLAERLGTTLLFDIGANEGQFARDLFDAGYRGRIVSVEPEQGAYERLRRRATSSRRWTVAERCALSDRAGTVALNVSANSVSSSLRPMTAAHSDADPRSCYAGTQTIAAVTFDELFASHLAADDRGVMLKIDVQGHEDAVLRGAATSLPQIDAIFAEVSLVELYAGQTLFREQLDHMESLGFSLWQLDPGFMDPRDGRLLQMDATFVRRDRFADKLAAASYPVASIA